MKANGSWLFSCLDTLCFNRTYGAREMRLLIVNYIRDNKKMFENHVNGNFNDYWDKLELDKTWGTYVTRRNYPQGGGYFLRIHN